MSNVCPSGRFRVSSIPDGLFRASGVFLVMPRTDLKPLGELFRAEVLKMLKKEGLIDDRFITMIMKWRYTSGFSVDNGVRIARDDQKGQTAVAQYIHQKPIFSGENHLRQQFRHGGL